MTENLKKFLGSLPMVVMTEQQMLDISGGDAPAEPMDYFGCTVHFQCTDENCGSNQKCTHGYCIVFKCGDQTNKIEDFAVCGIF